MMNILEQEDIVKGLPDQALMQEAQMPSGQVPQYLVVSEIQRRSDMRKRYKAEQEQMPQATVKEQVMQEGIMGAMPPQMAMAPQMAQRMPNMPPQGIQQAMPPEMMSGGGVARMFTGGEAGPRAIIENVLAQNPDATMVDFLQAGLTEEQAKAYYHLINPSMLDRARAKTPFGPPASEIYPDINLTGIETMVNESDRRRLEQIRSGEKYAQRKAAYDARNRVPVVNDPDAIDFADRQVDILSDPDDLSLLITDEERALNTEDALNQRFDQAQRLAKRLQAEADEKARLRSLITDEDRALNQADIREQRKEQFLNNMYGFFGDAYEGALDLAGAGIDRGIAGVQKGIQLLSPSVSSLYDDVAQSDIGQQVSQLFSGPPPSANINRDVDNMVEGLTFNDDPFADIDFFDQSTYKGEYKGADLGDGTPSDLAKVTAGQENDRSTPNSILRDILEDQKSADRVDVDDASISGSRYAMGLQDLLDKEIANASNQNKAAMLLTLGGGILQGKTGEAAEKVAQIATKGAQTQSALRLEGAKMRMKDYRDSQRMDLMLKDILARAGVAESRSDTATLNGVNDAIRQITNTPEYQQELILSRQSGEPGPRMLQLQDLNRARDLLFRKLSPGAFASRQAPTGEDFLELGI